MYVLATVGVLVAALVLLSVRSVAYAPLRELLLPPPKPIVVSVLYSTEKAAWIGEAVDGFEATRPRIQGRPIQLELKKMGSREMYLAVLDGTEQPDLMSTASMLQISILQDLSTSKFGAPVVNPSDREMCRSVLETPLVLVAWKERADVLWGDDPNGRLWLRLHDALTSPNGWEAYGYPEWGYIKFGHTNPLKSNSGFQTVLLMTYDELQANGDPQHIRAIVVLSDGEDTAPELTLDRLLSQVVSQSEGGTSTKIFTIAFGKDADKGVLQQIAEPTGGKQYDSDPRTINEVYADIATFF